jgi:hypothetical protein
MTLIGSSRPDRFGNHSWKGKFIHLYFLGDREGEGMEGNYI